MALKEYLGAIVLEVNGVEVEVESLDVTKKTGRKLVKTMNRTGRPAGFSKGVEEIDLKISVFIPVTGDLDWAAIEGAKLTVFPTVVGGKRTSYQECFTLDVGEKYSTDNEAKRDLSMACMREVIE